MIFDKPKSEIFTSISDSTVASSRFSGFCEKKRKKIRKENRKSKFSPNLDDRYPVCGGTKWHPQSKQTKE
jgi:hypothetical protein